MTKFAYVLVSGEYSGKMNRAVFLDKAKAEEICNKLNKAYDKKYPPRNGHETNYEYDIEVFEIGVVDIND